MLLAVLIGAFLLFMIAATLTQRSQARHKSRRHHPTNGL